MEYNLKINEALSLLINKKAKVIEKHDGSRCKVYADMLVGTRDYVPVVIDITDRWRVVK